MVESSPPPRIPKGFVGPANKICKVFYNAVKHLLHDDFFILNIGANDGVDNDPIHPFLLLYPAWRGLAVEPIPYNFIELERNYRDKYPGITLLQAAIGDTQKPLYYVDQAAGCDMRWVSQIASFDREYVEKSLLGIRLMAPPGTVTEDAQAHILEDCTIECVSLESLLEDNDINTIDFLNIDAECADFDIFSRFDLARYLPSILCIETACFEQREREEFDQRISLHGYRRVCEFNIFSEVFIRD